MFGLSIPTLRLIAIGMSALVSLGAVWWIYEMVKERGRAEVRTEMERKDKEAVDAAREARGPVRNCIDGGGLWSTARGVCVERRVPGVP